MWDVDTNPSRTEQRSVGTELAHGNVLVLLTNTLRPAMGMLMPKLRCARPRANPVPACFNHIGRTAGVTVHRLSSCMGNGLLFIAMVP